MTNTEAITKLTNIMHDDHYSWSPTILTAFGMAVDALRGAEAQLTQANTSNALKAMDCISRAEAIDYLVDNMTWYDEDGCESDEDEKRYAIEELIKGVPSAQPELRWIPCGKCIHADGKHRWCKILDRSINEDYFCYWAEPWKEGEAE